MTSSSKTRLPVQPPKPRKPAAPQRRTGTSTAVSASGQRSCAWKTSPSSAVRPTTVTRKPPAKPCQKTEPVPPPVQTVQERILVPPPIDVDAKPLASLTWLEQLRRLQQHIVNSPYFSWSVAAYVQVLLLVILGALVLSPVTKQEPLQITVSFSDAAPQVDKEEDKVVIAPPEVTPKPKPKPEPKPEEPVPELPEEPEEETSQQLEANQFSPPEVESSAKSEPADTPQGKTDTQAPPSKPPPKPLPKKPKSRTPEARPAPAHAVVVGAFSAWTEPAFPAPGEAYVIVIQVTLPERIKRYSSGDLSGVIIGADGYRKFIHGNKAHFLPIVHHTARIRVPVIGAERARQDSIIIQSRILRQRQLIELRYQ